MSLFVVVFSEYILLSKNIASLSELFYENV